MKRKQAKGATNKKRTRARTSSDAPKIKGWGVPQDRIDAMKAFKKRLESDPDECQRCHDSCEEARSVFIECGPFDPDQIPETTVFRVFVNGDAGDRREREKQVVLIVNPNDEDAEKLGNAQTWRCTYTPYREVRKRRRS